MNIYPFGDKLQGYVPRTYFYSPDGETLKFEAPNPNYGKDEFPHIVPEFSVVDACFSYLFLADVFEYDIDARQPTFCPILRTYWLLWNRFQANIRSCETHTHIEPDMTNNVLLSP